MDLINQNKNKATARMGLKLTALFTMLAPMALFANSNNGGISDSYLVIVLGTMLVIQIVLLYVISGVYKSLTANVSLWKKYLPSGNAMSIIALLAMLTSADVFAAGTESSGFILDSSLELLLISVNAFLLLVIIVLLVNVKKITRALQASSDEVTVEADVFSSIGFTDAVSIENENSILLDHDYDGIHELDNNLPPWWLWGFYITIAWAFGYAWYYLTPENYHVGDNEFVAEMQVATEEAEIRGASVDESSVKLLSSDADLAAGLEVYKTNCVVCHGAGGGGGVGPNLTDDSWIHGGGIKDVFRTIKIGVPEKGMISWESQLSPTDMQKVASFVLSLQGTNPEGGKAPEGNKWTGE